MATKLCQPYQTRKLRSTLDCISSECWPSGWSIWNKCVCRWRRNAGKDWGRLAVDIFLDRIESPGLERLVGIFIRNVGNVNELVDVCVWGVNSLELGGSV